MISVEQLEDFVKSLKECKTGGPRTDIQGVAIDDGGLTLVGIREDGSETADSLEVGGIPDEKYE